VERALLSAAFDVARVERALLPAAFDVDLDFESKEHAALSWFF